MAPPSIRPKKRRRIKKTVTNSGNLDKVEVYLFDGQKIIEIRNGSNAMVQQFIHGTQYVDELVMVRVKGERSERERVATGKASTMRASDPRARPKGNEHEANDRREGDLYVHQAEGDQGGSLKNWNVILDTPPPGKLAIASRSGVSRQGQVGTTDLGRHLVEPLTLSRPETGRAAKRHLRFPKGSASRVYSPYGELTVHQPTGFGDRDGDGDVDSNDSNVTNCTDLPAGACRIMDLDFDGGLDGDDQTLISPPPKFIAEPPPLRPEYKKCRGLYSTHDICRPWLWLRFW